MVLGIQAYSLELGSAAEGLTARNITYRDCWRILLSMAVAQKQEMRQQGTARTMTAGAFS